jgi:DNA-binding protein Fis
MNLIYKKGGNVATKEQAGVDFKGSLEKIDEHFFQEHEGRLHNFLVEALEKPLIEKILKQTDGNQVQAARVLGINRNTLRTKIRLLGIKKKIDY